MTRTSLRSYASLCVQCIQSTPITGLSNYWDHETVFLVRHSWPVFAASLSQVSEAVSTSRSSSASGTTTASTANGAACLWWVEVSWRAKTTSSAPTAAKISEIEKHLRFSHNTGERSVIGFSHINLLWLLKFPLHVRWWYFDLYKHAENHNPLNCFSEKHSSLDSKTFVSQSSLFSLKKMFISFLEWNCVSIQNNRGFDILQHI